MNTNTLDVFKTVTGLAVGAGVGKIVNDIIANNINTPETKIMKICVPVSAAVVGMMAKDASKSYTNTKIDETVKGWKKIKAQFKQNQEESTELESTEQS